MLEHTRPNLRILHPLPRVNEIAYDVDENPKAYYFQQAQNGLYAVSYTHLDVYKRQKWYYRAHQR